MASFIDIFNPSFFIFLGILVLVSALIVVYFESKMREQNHKIASMLQLVSCVADEMSTIKNDINYIKMYSNHNSEQSKSINLEPTLNNNLEINMNKLILVSDNESDSESEPDCDSESDSDESNTDSDSDSDSETELIEDKLNSQIIEISDIKVLKINNILDELNKPYDLDESNNLDDLDDLDDLNNLDDLNYLDDLDESDDEANNLKESNLLDISINFKNDEDDNEKKSNLNISDLNLKTINISDLEEVKYSSDNDYKKMPLSKLRLIVMQKGIVGDSSKFKKNELLKLLGCSNE